jgi:hypothetical protein
MALGTTTALLLVGSAPILDTLGQLLQDIQAWIAENRLPAAVIGLACAGLFIIVSAQMGLRRAMWLLAGLIFLVGAIRFAQDLIGLFG